MAHVLDKVARVPAVCVCIFFFKMTDMVWLGHDLCQKNKVETLKHTVPLSHDFFFLKELDQI